jgi:hypothetical protein
MVEIRAMIATIIRRIRHTPAVIQSGENTHNQDHESHPVILAITKMIVSHPTRPILFALSISALVLIYWLMANGEPPPLAGCHAVYA